MKRLLPLSLLILALYSTELFAVEPATPGNPTYSLEYLMTNALNTNGVFEPLNDGSFRHLQSGLICPAKLPSANLWQLMVFSDEENKGADVGCSYGRARRGTSGKNPESKTTLFARRSEPGMNLDEAFKTGADEYHRAFPSARLLGEALQLKGENVASLPQVRSEEYEVLHGQRKFVDQILVSLIDGWIITIRATYPTEFSSDDPDVAIDVAASAYLWSTNVVAFANEKHDTKK
jgi:hypothetical protein